MLLLQDDAVDCHGPADCQAGDSRIRVFCGKTMVFSLHLVSLEGITCPFTVPCPRPWFLLEF